MSTTAVQGWRLVYTATAEWAQMRARQGDLVTGDADDWPDAEQDPEYVPQVLLADDGDLRAGDVALYSAEADEWQFWRREA